MAIQAKTKPKKATYTADKPEGEKRCADCSHLLVDNSPDQTGPSIWCGKNHFDGIGSKEEYDDLSKGNNCADFAAAQPPAAPLGEADDKIREWLKQGSKGVCRWVSADERLPEGYNRIPVKWSETGYDIGDRSRIQWLMSLGHKNVRWLEDLPSSPSK